jgi:hypothetical protein
MKAAKAGTMAAIVIAGLSLFFNVAFAYTQDTSQGAVFYPTPDGSAPVDLYSQGPCTASASKIAVSTWGVSVTSTGAGTCVIQYTYGANNLPVTFTITQTPEFPTGATVLLISISLIILISSRTRFKFLIRS